MIRWIKRTKTRLWVAWVNWRIKRDIARIDRKLKAYAKKDRDYSS